MDRDPHQNPDIRNAHFRRKNCSKNDNFDRFSVQTYTYLCLELDQKALSISLYPKYLVNYENLNIFFRNNFLTLTGGTIWRHGDFESEIDFERKSRLIDRFTLLY